MVYYFYLFLKKYSILLKNSLLFLVEVIIFINCSVASVLEILEIDFLSTYIVFNSFLDNSANTVSSSF